VTDLASLSDRQLMALKSANGDLSKLDDATLMALRPRQAQGESDALGSAIGRGVTFGAGDELGATVRAAAPGFSNWMMSKSAFEQSLAPNQNPPAQTVSNAPTYDERYTENLAQMRGQAEADKAAYPVMTTAGEIGGNVLGTGALAMTPYAGALIRGGGGAGLIGNTVRGAATGAVLGGAQGFAEGEGGVENRLGNAVVPAAFGLGVGALAPAVAKGAGYIYDRAAPSVLDGLAKVAEKVLPGARPAAAAAPQAYGPQTVQQRLAATIAPRSPAQVWDDLTNNAGPRTAQSLRTASDDIEKQVATKYLAQVLRGKNSVDATEAAVNAPGGDWMIADANKATGRAAFSTQANSDDAAQRMSEKFLERNQRAGNTFINEGGVPVARDPSVAEQEFKKLVGTEGQRLYDPVLRGNAQLNVSPDMERLIAKNDDVREAVQRVMEQAGRRKDILTPAEVSHLVKRQLNLNAEAKIAAGTPVDRKMVEKTAAEWEGALWAANDPIKQADTAYAKIAGLHEDWFKRGQEFAARGRGAAAQNASPEAIAAHLKGATPEQIAAFREGTAAEMRRIASEGGDSTRRLAKVLGDGDQMVGRLSEVFGPDEARQIITSGNARRAQAETFKDVMRGSPTAERTMSLRRDADLMPPAGGDVGSLVRWFKDAAAKLDTPTEAARVRLAQILTTMDKKEQKAALDAVRRFQQQQRQSTFKPGVAGSAAGAAAPSNR
jgi:hypothetical protein